MFNLITLNHSTNQDQIKVNVNSKGHVELYINDQVFNIKLFDLHHHSLTKTMDKNNKEETFKSIGQKIKNFVELYLKDNEVELSKCKPKLFKITLDSSNQIKIKLNHFQSCRYSAKKTCIFIRNSISSSSANKDSKLVIELRNVTPDRVLQKIYKIYKDIIGLFINKKLKTPQEIKKSLKNIIENIPKNFQASIIKRFNQITRKERYLTNYLLDRVDWTGIDQEKTILEILKGAYVYLEDEGQTFHQWTEHLEDKFPRYSSHTSNTTQYSIQGKIIKEMLFSKKLIKDETGLIKEVSWFQCERYGLKLGHFLRHMGSWAAYKKNRKNQGPFGESFHTEKSNPIILRLKQT